MRPPPSTLPHRAPAAALFHPWQRITCLIRIARPCGENRTATRRADVFFPHFAPPPLTCVFAARIDAGARFGLVLVEECGVQWGVVE
jgi:hypothetical protein